MEDESALAQQYPQQEANEHHMLPTQPTRRVQARCQYMLPTQSKAHTNPLCYLPCLTKLLSKISHEAPKIRLASHENQLTPSPRNHVVRTRHSLPPVTVAEPKNRSGSAAMTTSGHATTNKGPGGGRSKAGT